MPPAHAQLVLESVKVIAESPDDAGRIFYDRLFLIAPDVRLLFPEEMAAQQKKFIQTLVWIVDNLHEPDELSDMLVDLGRRHAGFGVQDQDYAKVGEALLWTVEERLGGEFTPEVRAAWSAAYQRVADTMKMSGARRPPTGDRAPP